MKAENKMSYFISNTSQNNLSRPRKINELKLRCKHKMKYFIYLFKQGGGVCVCQKLKNNKRLK